MKKLTIVTILLTVLMSMVGTKSFAEEIEIGVLRYDITEGKARVIQSKIGKPYTGNIIIPETVEYGGANYIVNAIGDHAFDCCRDLTSIAIPNSITTIGYSAFFGCSNLIAVAIPSSVTSIERLTFYGCSNLTSVTIPNSVTSIGDNAFEGCNSLTSVTIPNSVTSIGLSAFINCSGLTSITISNNIASLEGVFSGCSGLTSVTIPNSVTKIGDRTFEGCSGLTSITIPNSVTRISYKAFDGCSGLTSITLGKNISNIFSLSFANCTKLTDVFCFAEYAPSAHDLTFDGSFIEKVTLHVPNSAIYSYKATAPWSGFKDIVPISEGQVTKCATPTISFENGKIKFNCETEGAEFISEVASSDAKTYYDSEISLLKKYTVSVYATKTGYENSDVATKEITISDGGNEQSGIRGDLNGDNEVNVADHVELTKIIMATGTNPEPDPVDPSGDDEPETDMISASFLGGAYSIINGKIQSGSQLNVKFSNKSSKSVTLTKVQLNDAETGSEGNNLLTEEVVVAAGQDVSYTITVGLLGIYKPVICFTYRYKNKTYEVKSEWE